MADLREALNLLLATFEEYAGKEGDNNTLTKSEIITLLHNEFPNADKGKAEVDTFFHKMDDDKDGVVDFKEFVKIVTDFKLIYS